jgi:two-component system, sensor histidine kinase
MNIKFRWPAGGAVWAEMLAHWCSPLRDSAELSVLWGMSAATDLQTKVACHQFRLLIAHYPVRLLLETVGALLWFAVNGHYRKDGWPLVWLLLALPLIALGAVGTAVFLRTHPPDKDLRKWEVRCAYWNWCMGAVWGGACFFAHQHPFVQPFLAFCSLMAIAATLNLHTVYRPSMSWMLLPCILLTAIQLLKFGRLFDVFGMLSFIAGTWALLSLACAHNKVMTQVMLASEDRLALLHTIDTQRALAHHANMAKTQFLAAVSHDLRQPIHTIAILMGSLLPKQPASVDWVEKISVSVHEVQALLQKHHQPTFAFQSDAFHVETVQPTRIPETQPALPKQPKWRALVHSLWRCMVEMASPWLNKPDVFLSVNAPDTYRNLGRSQFHTFYTQAASDAPLQLGVSIVLAGAALATTPTVAAFAWATCSVLLAGFLALYPIRYAYQKNEPLALRAIESTYGRLATLQGVLWGLVWCILSPAALLAYVPYFAIILLLAIALDLRSATGYGPALFWRAVPCMTLTSLTLMSGDEHFLVIDGLGFLAVVLFMIHSACVQHAFVTKTLRLSQDRVQLLSELEVQRTAAQHAHEVKTRLLTTVSRDLQKPIHLMASLSQSLLQHAGNQTGLIAQMNASIEATEVMLQALSEVSQIDSGSLPLHQETLALDVLLRRIELQFSAQAVSKGLRLRIMPCSLRVRSDAFQLQRILSNLVANAIRYTVQGHIVVRCRLRGSMLWLQVWDSGIGIAREDRQRIFEEFVQLGTLPSQQASGLGLGLSIVQKLAQRLDHPLQLRSRRGRCSVFAVGLPCVDTFVAVPSLEKDHAALLHLLDGKLVLLIDSDTTALHDMQSRLQAYRCAVVVASSTAQSLAQVEQTLRIPDLILCDYRLGPADTGLECISQVRAAVGECIPALLMMAERTPPLKAAQPLDVPVLGKPVELKDLLVGLQRLQALTADLIP